MAQIDKLKSRIPQPITGIEEYSIYIMMLNDLLEDSKNIALSNLYPFKDWSILSLPTKYENWQIRACIELYNLADKSGIISYGENGLSWSKLSDGLSVSLMDEITPSVGTIKLQTGSDDNV